MGGFGNDTLGGQGGDDRLAGGDLTDSTAGAAGHDLLTGGSWPFDALHFGALDAAAFHLGTTATKAGQQIRYDRATGVLAYDADGRDAVAAVVVAVLDQAPRIDATDFFVL